MPPIPQRYGNYQLVEEIGRGGMGIVYKAFDPNIKRFVALKVLIGISHADERQRFQREIDATAQLSHPSIVTIHNSGINENGRPYQVLEYLEGQSLKAWALEKQAPISSVVTIMTTIARAVDFAHSKGFIHRDIKAANIFLCSDGQVKLLDFGIAKCLFEMQGESLTQSGVVLGSLPFMAPEQLRNDAITPSLDIYALGATLYFLLTRQTPFNAAQAPIRLALDIEERTPETPQNLNPEVSEELAKICLKALAKQPKDRFSSAEEFALALENLGKNSAPAKAKHPTVIPGIVALIAAVVLAVIGLAVFKGKNIHRDAQETPLTTLPFQAPEETTKPPRTASPGLLQLPVHKISSTPLFLNVDNDEILDLILIGHRADTQSKAASKTQLFALSGKTGAVLWRYALPVSENARPRWQNDSKRGQAIVVGTLIGEKRRPALAWIDKDTGQNKRVVELPGVPSTETAIPDQIFARDKDATGRWGWTVAYPAFLKGSAKKDTLIFHFSKRGNLEYSTSLKTLGLTGEFMSDIVPIVLDNKAPLQYMFQLNNSIFSYTFDPTREPRRWLRSLQDGIPHRVQFHRSPNNPDEVLEVLRFKNKAARASSHLRIRNIESGIVRWPEGTRYKHKTDIIWGSYFNDRKDRRTPFLAVSRKSEQLSVIELYDHLGQRTGRKQFKGAFSNAQLFRSAGRQLLFITESNSNQIRLYSLPQLTLCFTADIRRTDLRFYPIDIDKDGHEEIISISSSGAFSIMKANLNQKE